MVWAGRGREKEKRLRKRKVARIIGTSPGTVYWTPWPAVSARTWKSAAPIARTRTSTATSCVLSGNLSRPSFALVVSFRFEIGEGPHEAFDSGSVFAPDNSPGEFRPRLLDLRHSLCRLPRRSGFRHGHGRAERRENRHRLRLLADPRRRAQHSF